MLPETPSSKLEDYLPPAGPKLTYSDLLKGYGKWWQAQPSLTPYKRFYDIDSEPHYLIVWEGYPGFYDFYGDFAEDNTFYNHVVKGYTIYFHTRFRGDMFQIRVFSVPAEKPSYERFYENPAAMRSGMIAEWPQIVPTLGEQGERLKQFIEDNAHKVMSLLNEYARLRSDTRTASPRRYALVYRSGPQIYLCLWMGEEHAIRQPPASDESGSPIFDRSAMTSYAVFRVSFMRLPVRFEVALRQWPMPFDRPVAYKNLIPSDVSMNSFKALEDVLFEALIELPF